MIPSEKEILDFIKKRENLVNLSMIANFYNIKNSTASDLVDDLVRKKLVEVKKLGGSKIVRVKKAKK